jgi:hypothetical protein
MATGRIWGLRIITDMQTLKPVQFLSSTKNKNRVEFLCFCIAAFLVLNPILAMNWFVTEDGASHSYNAGVLYKLLFGNDQFLKQYYSINSLPAPNWLGHLLLAFFNEWFGVDTGAKILHLVYGFGLIFSFRGLMFVVSPSPRVMSYLIFPLVFNTVFLFGFYNFCLGVVLFLLGITAWLNYLSNANWRNLLLFGFLVTCGWFSHILTWLFTGVFVFVSLSFLAFQLKSLRQVLKPAVAALLSFLPSLVCWLIYTLRMTETGYTDYKPVSERLQEFLNFRFAVMLSDVEQGLFLLFVVMIIGLLVVGLYRYYQYRKYSKPEKQQKMILWGAVFLVSLLTMLFFPEATGGGGVFGIRLEWISWILLLVFVSGFHFPARWGITIAVVALVLSLSRNFVIRQNCENMNRDAHAAAGAGKYIREQSTVLVLPFATSWLNLHLGKYAVTGRDIALLSNYECDHQYFPLRWNEDAFPHRYQLASIDPNQVSCSWEWKTNLKKIQRQVDYVMIVGDINNISDTLCAQKIICAMDSLNYQAIYKKREITLYEYKPR